MLSGEQDTQQVVEVPVDEEVAFKCPESSQVQAGGRGSRGQGV